MGKRFRERYRNSRNLQIFIIICGAILFYLLLNHLSSVRNALGFIFGILAPIILAAVIAFLLHPIVMFFEKKVFGRLRIKRKKYLHGFCVILTVLLICVLLILILYLVIYQLASSVTHLVSNLDNYMKAFSGMLNNLIGDTVNDVTIFGVNLLQFEETSMKEVGTTIVNWVTGHGEGIIGGAMSVGSNIMNSFITVMLVIYMLLDADHLKKSTTRYLRSVMEPSSYVRFSEICANSSRIFLRYFGSNLLDSLIIGVLCYIFMIVLGLPYALLIAVVVGVTNFIPTFGPIVGAIISAFLILVVNPWGALWFIIYSLVSQFFDANLIKPKLFGDTTGLRPMWVLAAIIICGGLFGVVGMLLGVPLFAIIAIVLDERVEKRLQRWDYAKEDIEQEETQESE